MRVKLQRQEWTLGERIGAGGFCEVVAARSDSGEEAAAKLIPKEPDADRELLIVDLTNARHVLPVIDRGETETHLVLVMPRAEKSLLKHLDDLTGPLAVAEVVAMLTDLAETLSDLDGKVVHRDVKPANLLWHESHWCLSDFGIARYAEASTSMDTRKYAMSPPYAAPERWRDEHATEAADVYAFGVIAYELLSGARPFNGVNYELRDQHLHRGPAPLGASVPPRLAALVEQCLHKPAEARPAPGEVLARLTKSADTPMSTGFAALSEAGRADVARRGEEARSLSEARSAHDRKAALYGAAVQGLTRIRTSVEQVVRDEAPTAVVRVENSRLVVRLGQANLILSTPVPITADPWGGAPLPFDVIACAELSVRMPSGRLGYEGRGHSLWYCDAQAKGRYQWFETAFMAFALKPQPNRTPFSLSPGTEAGMAVRGFGADNQHAWPFTVLVPGELDDFLIRWTTYLASASVGSLERPNRMPERPVDGSWRTT